MGHFVDSYHYALHNTKAQGTLLQVTRRLSTDAGKYSFKVWAVDFKSRKQADLPIQWFAVWRESGDKIQLIRTGTRTPVNNVYPKAFIEAGVPEFMVPEEDVPKIKAILNAANKKLSKGVLEILVNENPAKYTARQLWRFITS